MRYTWLKWASAWRYVLIIALVCVFVQPVQAVTFDEHIIAFQDKITIQSNGDIDIIEKIHYDFGINFKHGIYRTLPISYPTDTGTLTLPISIHSVTDEKGTNYQYTPSNDGDTIKIKIGDPNETTTGDHWYNISYSVSKAVNNFSDHDELYWNVTGNDWNLLIDKATAEVNLPTPTSDQKNNQVKCYTGAAGSTAQYCDATVLSNSQFKFSTKELSSNEGLTIVASFPKGIVTPFAAVTIPATSVPATIHLDQQTTPYSAPITLRLDPGMHTISATAFEYASSGATLQLQSGDTITLPISLSLYWWAAIVNYYVPVLVLILFSWLVWRHWWEYGRTPKGRATIIAEYEPPANLTPGEVGTLVDLKVNQRDLAASIIHLATQGYLTIKAEKHKKLFGESTEYTFIKKDHPTSLPNFEQKLFGALFPGNTKEQSLSGLRTVAFGNAIKEVTDALYDTLVHQAYFSKSPESIRVFYTVLGIFIVAFSAIGGVALVVINFSQFIVWPICAAIFGIELFILSFLRSPLTVNGKIAQQHILGFKLFLGVTETDRLKFFNAPAKYTTGDTFETYLPYAIALQVENDWAKKFADIYKQQPNWYVGDYDHTSFGLTASLLAFHTVTLHTMSGATRTASAAASGHSGFGGSSGGGFGGGGGGSW